mmetsp:Transcript_28656/g.54159  ORF Transcript_28656/g.54159 Transcript_28656/m.54159 type:complete len:258 (-) Transcript_28656:652-1425(-)
MIFKINKEERSESMPSARAPVGRDPNPRGRFHDHWINNTSTMSAIGADEERGAGTSATATHSDVIRGAATTSVDNRFHDYWNNASSLSTSVTEDDGEPRASATATDRDAIRAATTASVDNRFHDHWNNTSLFSTSGTEDEGEPGMSATATDRDAIPAAITASEVMIQDQYEHDSRWQYLSAFESRARHSHWNNGIGESTMPVGGDTDDESSLDSYNEETTASNYTLDVEDHDQIMVDSIAQPMFLGIRKFFSGSRRA